MARGKMDEVVMVDLDGVLVDFVLGYTTLAKELGYIPEAFSTEDPRYSRWDIAGVSGPQNNVIWEKIKASETWWTTLKPLQERSVFLAIDDLQKDVYFVTSRPGRGVKRQTEEWLEQHGISTPTVIISSRKGDIAAGLSATYMVDDKAGNAVYVAYHSPETGVYLLDRQTNRFDPSVLGSRITRIQTLNPFMDAISH
jgi:hypothetical protein